MITFQHKFDCANLLQTQVLRVGQVNEPCIGLIQENSMEFLLQSSLSYIPFGNGLC